MYNSAATDLKIPNKAQSSAKGQHGFSIHGQDSGIAP